MPDAPNNVIAVIIFFRSSFISDKPKIIGKIKIGAFIFKSFRAYAVFSEWKRPKTKIKKRLQDKVKSNLFFFNNFIFSRQFHSKNHEKDIKIKPTDVPNLETGILIERPYRPK